MHVAARSVVPMALVLACAACSQPHGPAQPSSGPVPAATAAATAPAPADAIPMTAPAATGSSALPQAGPPDKGPSLAGMLRRPAFAKALASVDGVSRLPGWVGKGGVSTPSHKVELDGRSMWLAHGCKSSDCGDGEVWLLVDQDTRVIQGLYVDERGDSDARVRELVWLGKPDAATRTFLKQRVSED